MRKFLDKIKILIVDDHPVFRDGLYDVLETIENFIIVGAVGDGEQAIEMALQLHPDVIIMDINLPTINGIQATRKIKAQLADVKVVIITGYDDKEQVFHALRAGASAYCPKDITPEILADAIDTVCRGNYYIVEKPFTYNELLNWIEQNVGQFSNSLITNESKVIPLSPREMEILHAVTYGFSNKEIASKLGISHQTVKNHLNAILRKLNVSDRIQASVYALRQGWVALQGKANGDNKKNLLASDSNDDSSILLNSTTAMWIHRINNLLSASVLELNNILSLIDKDQEKARLHLNKMKTRLAEEVKSIRESDNLTLIVKDTDNSSSPVSVNKIVQEFIEDYQFSISDIGNKTDFSKLALNLEPNLPDAVSNENILKDIIRVLVDNAFRAIKPIPDGKILIETKFMDEKIIIDISDNGIGMPGYIAENLFKSPISNPDGGGLGLGLLLTAKLVKYWDGDISLLRSNDSGSVIRISLLKWPNTNTNINTSASLARALVVDDNIMWQEAISQQLASRGLSVDVAGNENTTMSLLKECSYDLALLDLRLSTWDVSSQAGINIARSVRERNPEALIVILTGYGSFESVREAFRLGVDDFLDKAEFIEKGLNKIDRLIDQLAVQRETQRESFRQSQINKYIYEILAMFSHELEVPSLDYFA